jgi:hypothetical protein
VSGAVGIVFDRATSSGGFPECQARNACFAGYTKQYGLKHAKFLPLAGISRMRRSTQARFSPRTSSRRIAALLTVEVHGAT